MAEDEGPAYKNVTLDKLSKLHLKKISDNINFTWLLLELARKYVCKINNRPHSKQFCRIRDEWRICMHLQ